MLTENTSMEWGLDNDVLSKRTEGYLASLVYYKTDKEYAANWMHDHFYPIGGGCTSFRTLNGIRGRNYDWLYDKHPTFIIRTKAHDGKYATVGIAEGFGELEADFVKNKFTSDLYNVLPYIMLDGTNSEGLNVSINVCQKYNDNGELDITKITDKSGDELCGGMIVRELLDNCRTVQNCKTFIADKNIYMPNTESMQEEFHYMVSDKFGNTSILEFRDNEPVWTDYLNSNAVMTNYKIIGDTGHDYGSGYERSQIVTNMIENGDDPADILKAVWYTNTYKSFKEEWETQWLSECNGKGTNYDLHQGLPASDYDYVKGKMVEFYEARTRENPITWQTVHSTIYDPNNNKITLYVQERDIPFEIEMFKESEGTEFVDLYEPNLQFKNLDSKLLVNGKLYVYDAVTDTLADIYSDDGGNIRLTQPVRTNNQGRAEIYVESDKYYRLEVYTAENKLLWTRTGRPPLFMNHGVVHDETLLGDGTMENELKVNTEVIASQVDLAAETLARQEGDAYLQFQIDNIQVDVDVKHDDTLSGNGTDESPLGVVSAGMADVKHDDTLSGNGTEESPLGVSPLVSLATESPITNRTEGNQLIIGIDSTALMPEVKHDDTLSGNGTDASPLGVVSAGMAEVHHDSNLSGDGTTTNPLGINSAFEVKSEIYGEGNYDRFAYGKDEYGETGPYLIKEWNSTSNPEYGSYTVLHVDPGVMLWKASSYDTTSTATGNVIITTGDVRLQGKYGDGTEFDCSLHNIGDIMDRYSSNWISTTETVSANSANWNGKLSVVSHDTNISGDGTSNSPLGLNKDFNISADNGGASAGMALTSNCAVFSHYYMTPISVSNTQYDPGGLNFTYSASNNYTNYAVNPGTVQWLNENGGIRTLITLNSGDISLNRTSTTGSELYSLTGLSNSVNNKLDTTAFSEVSGDFATKVDMEKANGRIETNSANIGALETWKETVTPIVAGVISGVTNNNNTLTFTKVDGSTTAVTITGGGHTYNGISGINVDNTNNTVGLNAETTAILSSVSSQTELVAGANITLTETENGLVIAAQGGALPQSADWNSCYNSVNSNSGTWNTVTAKQDKLTFSYDSDNKISGINASALAGKTYNAGNNIDITNDNISVTGLRELFVQTPLTTGTSGTSAYIGLGIEFNIEDI